MYFFYDIIERDHLVFRIVAIWDLFGRLQVFFCMKNQLYDEGWSSKRSMLASGLSLQSLKQYKQGFYKNIIANLPNGDRTLN